MKKISVFLALFAIIISASYAAGSGEQLVKQLQSKFNSVSNLTADFKQTSNGRVILSGKFFYGKGNKLRLELNNLVIVSDGKTSWSYNKREKKVIISNFDPNDPSIISLDRIINNYPANCTVSLEKDAESNVLDLVPKKSGMSFKKAKIFINSENLIQKMVLTDQNNNQAQIEFSNYQLDKNLSASTFTFTPPKGNKVIDIR